MFHSKRPLKRHCTQLKNVYSAYVPGLVSSRIKTSERLDHTPAVILMSDTFLWNPLSPICQLCSAPDKIPLFQWFNYLVFDHRLSVWMHLSEAELWAINVLYAHRKRFTLVENVSFLYFWAHFTCRCRDVQSSISAPDILPHAHFYLVISALNHTHIWPSTVRRWYTFWHNE